MMGRFDYDRLYSGWARTAEDEEEEEEQKEEETDGG